MRGGVRGGMRGGVRGGVSRCAGVSARVSGHRRRLFGEDEVVPLSLLLLRLRLLLLRLRLLLPPEVTLLERRGRRAEGH